jgi:cobalt-zinc-cadmium efflux system outer membrane protein
LGLTIGGASVNPYAIVAMSSAQKLISLALAVSVLVGCAHYQAKPISLDETAKAFEGRSLTNAEMEKFVAAARPGVPSSPIEKWDFESLALAAVLYQPAFRLVQAQSETATAGKITARARPNPTLTASPGYDFSATGGANPWIPAFNFDLPVETAGKRGKRMAQAARLEEAARLDVTTAAWQTRAAVRGAMIELWFGLRREELIANQLTNQSALVRFLEQRVEAGAIARNEILPMQVTRVKLESDLALARTAVAQGRVKLAESIGVSAKALDGARIDLASAARGFAAEKAEFKDEALRHRADILAALARYEAAQAALRLEIAKQYPDVHFGPAYQWDQGDHKWNLAIGVELPIFNRNQGLIAEAEAKRAEAAARVIETQTRALAEIEQAAAALRAAREELERAGRTRETLGQVVASMRAQFEAGAADQVDLRTALVEESAANAAALDAEMRAAAAAAQLENALQVDGWAPLVGASNFARKP